MNITTVSVTLIKKIVLLFLVFGLVQPVSAQQTIRFGILSIAQPARIHTKWQPFVDYVASKMQHKVEIIIPRGFKKMRKAATEGKVDFFYINSRVFYRLKSKKQAIGVLQMQNIDGKVTSQSEIYVRKDSGIKKLEQLRGKTIAYVSPMGAGGYLAPRAKLMSLGIISGEEVKEKFTKSLTNSIHGVLLKDTASGTMCGVNFKLMSKRIDTGDLLVIGISDEYPENVIAARQDIDTQLLTKFQQVIADMPNSEQGRAVLKKMHSMKITKFLPYDASIEEMTKNLLIQAKLTP